uniref:Uncharacterized protein n=1 Tax=Rhizophora mucronata TaxID=61149 RepID=A0A2P2MCI8_RHIMU
MPLLSSKTGTQKDLFINRKSTITEKKRTQQPRIQILEYCIGAIKKHKTSPRIHRNGESKEPLGFNSDEVAAAGAMENYK